MTEQGHDTFHDELTALLNRYNWDGHANTPDFMLAHFMKRCLEAYEDTVRSRDTWNEKTDPLTVTAIDEVEAEVEEA